MDSVMYSKQIQNKRLNLYFIVYSSVAIEDLFFNGV